MNTPRPECLQEPCNAWEPRQGYCGHKVIYGPEACILDDPERRAQRDERLRRAAMEGK